SFGIGMRTRILDEWILSVIRENGIASVLSVGAGLDSRPWRLKLPSDLLWTEVDLQPMLDYKRAVLAEDQPRCRLKRMAVDLNDTSQRATLYGAAGGGPTLLITEGLLMYLPAATVQSLASETAAASEICCWMMDATTSTLRRSISTATFKDIDAMRAADHLTCEEILAVVALAGWHPAESRTYRVYGMEVMPPARRHTMARMAAESGVPTAPPPPIDDRSGVHLFTRPAA
ncbi:MAG: class I SAM-dependent methyltransferase, partial [Bryobacteraceae bacterium]